MTSLPEIEARLNRIREDRALPALATSDELLELGGQILTHWLLDKGVEPTSSRVEGFSLLALHRQGCKGDPSFNACRESCRELVYQRNLIHADPQHPETEKRLAMACAVARHLLLFIGGKLQDPDLGDFCCSSRPLHQAASA